MLNQHYHITDSDKDSDINEVEVYWNSQSNIVIREEEGDSFLSFIVLTPEMAKDMIHALGNMVAEMQ